MRRLALAFAALALTASAATADTYVNGYYKKDGTYVQGHWKSDANSTKEDNYSTTGNTNPYTGKNGTKDSESTSYGPPYGTEKKKDKDSKECAQSLAYGC